MKNPFSLPPTGSFLHALSSVLFGVGTAYPLLAALDLPVSFSLCLLCCALSGAAYLLLSCVRWFRGLYYPLMAVGMLLPFAPYAANLPALGNALILLINGQPLALSAYARPAAILLSLFMSAIGLSLARSEGAFFSTAIIAIGVLFAVSFSGADSVAVAMLPLAGAALLFARARGVTLPRLLPHLLLTALLTTLLMPYAGTSVPALEEAAAKTKQAIDDYLFFNDARTAFSLSAVGWQPLGSERLGGAIAPSDAPVMQVETSGRTLLRGITKNEYTGLSWRDSTTPRRYLFVGPRFMQLKNDLFDLSRPEKEILSALPQEETFRVTMSADAASTLYLTQRFRSPAGEGIVAYFSPSGELFATHSLEMGESYAFQGRRLTSETSGVRAAVLGAASTQDSYAQEVREMYLQLPSSIDPGVYELAASLCARLDNDYDRAAAICMHLQNSYPYTLLQHEPPVNRDFVSWFLLEERQGYCTSFASAMAVMCRAMGIPARYIEGYAAEPDADGIARVTQQNAHAWVEVYFPGFGWLSFDPTPGSGQAPDTTDYASEEDSPSPNPDAPENEEESPSPSPSPTQTPTPSPSPAPSPSPTPEHNDPSVTPTPELTPTPTPAPTPLPTDTPTPPEKPDDPQDRSFLYKLIALLLLLLLSALCAWRLYRFSPGVAGSRMRLSNDALLLWYAAIEEALRAQNIIPAPGEAPASFLLRAQEQLGGKLDLMPLGKSVCDARYSCHKLSKKHIAGAQKVYAALIERLSFAQAMHLYLRRILLGKKLYS